jgi:hypothetical protein
MDRSAEFMGVCDLYSADGTPAPRSKEMIIEIPQFLHSALQLFHGFKETDILVKRMQIL